MATYSASDLIGKTIFVTGKVPAYKRATLKGEKRQTPLFFFTDGDSFVVDSYIKQRGTYTNFDDNYWTGVSQGKQFAVAFKEIAGKYNTTAITNQGVKSDEQKKKELQEKKDGVVLTTLKKIAPLAIGAIIIAAYIGRRK